MTCPLLYRYRTIDRLPEEPSRRRPARHPGAQGARGPLRPARRPTAPPTRPRDLLVPDVGRRCSTAEPDARRDVHRRGPRRRRVAGLLPRRRSTATSRWRTRAGSSRPSGSSTSRRCSTPGCCCAGFVDRLDVAPDGAIRVVDYKTGPVARRDVRGQGAVPDEVLRAGHLAHPRRRPGDAPAGLPRQRRDAALRPRRGRPARHRAQGRGDLAGDPARRGDRRLAAQPHAGCATGAPSRRCAPSSAAPRRRCPTGPATAASSPRTRRRSPP